MYDEIDPDLMLINSHGVLNDEKIKIFNYTVYQSNKLDGRNKGFAIAIKRNIKHRIRDKFHSDLLSIELDTDIGVTEIVTSYVPPRVGYLHYPDFL